MPRSAQVWPEPAANAVTRVAQRLPDGMGKELLTNADVVREALSEPTGHALGELEGARPRRTWVARVVALEDPDVVRPGRARGVVQAPDRYARTN